MNQMTNHDKEMLELIRDPVTWAEHHLGQKPRWYQEQILRHPHNRKVLRCGRRIGKCIEETQRILNPITGEYKSVGELFQSQEQQVNLLTLDKTFQIGRSQSFHIEDNGMKEVFKISLKHGAEVKLTDNHPVLTVDGWKEVSSLRIGESIAVPKALPFYGTRTEDKHRLRILAFMLAAGRISRDHVSLQVRYDGIWEAMNESCAAKGIRTYRLPHKKTSLYLYQFTSYQDFQAIRNGDIPNWVYELDKEHLSYFLGCLYAAGGWAFAGRIVELGYGTRKHQFAINLKHLLLRFGITSNILKKEANGEDYYHLMIYHRTSVLLFLQEIATNDRDYSELRRRANEMSSSDPTLPKEIWRHIENERVQKGLKKSEVIGSRNRRFRTESGISLSNAREYAENLESRFLFDLVNGGILWEEIVDIAPIGRKQTYDVYVPETHNLVCEDILVHNTWTMVAHMMWVAFTRNGGRKPKGATVVVATPYETQAKLIFDEIMKHVEGNPILKDAVATSRKNPYEIVWKNGSRIKLFTAGSKSGNQGGSLRGQACDWLYCDEMDYMDDASFEAIYAITFENPKNIGVMVSSTPTGRRGAFWKICTQMKFNQEIRKNKFNKYDVKSYDREAAEGWMEFHFPSSVNPGWSPSMEKELRQQFTEVAYDQEVNANFGTEMVGVFNKDFIDEASSIAYNYLNSRNHNAPIAVGVDWDKYGAETQIVVVQFDPNDPRRIRTELGENSISGFGRFKVINRISIPKSEMSYDVAVQKLIEIDYKYEPFAIYCDRGAGELLLTIFD
jgi:intein/homing endonuclease